MDSTIILKPLPDCKPTGPCAHPKPTLSILIPSNAMALSQGRARPPSPSQQPLDVNAAAPTPPNADYSPTSWDDEPAPSAADLDAQYMQALKLAQARSAWEQECEMRWCRFITFPLPSIFPRGGAGGAAASGSTSRSCPSDAKERSRTGTTPVIGPDVFAVTPVDARHDDGGASRPGSELGSTDSDDDDDDDDGGCLVGCFNPWYPGCFKCS